MYLPLSTQAAVKSSERSVWIPYNQKGEKDKGGKERKASTWASSHLNQDKKKWCGPETPSAQGMCWTALISAPLVDKELEDMLSLELWKHATKSVPFFIPSNFTLQEKNHPKLLKNNCHNNNKKKKKEKNREKKNNTQTSLDSHIPTRMFQI